MNRVKSRGYIRRLCIAGVRNVGYIFSKPAPAGPVLFQRHLAENIAKANHNRPLLPSNDGQ